jgi:hypothetical protein
MTDPHTDLINALRRELEEYGEMLARLDRQQDAIVRRAADDVLAGVTDVQDQATTLQQSRQAREEVRRRLARHCRRPEDATLTQLAESMPAHYKPLLQALVEENNHLLVRVQQRARQNHLLLRRSLDLMQHLLQTIIPTDPVGLYDSSGHSFAGALPAHALCDAAG